MSSFEQDFQTAVLANAGVAALIGTRLYYQKPPQNPTYPLATWGLVIGVPEQAMNDTLSGGSQHYWLESWDTDPDSCHTLALALRDAVVALSGTNFSMGNRRIPALRDLYDPDSFLFHWRLDAVVHQW